METRCPPSLAPHVDDCARGMRKCLTMWTMSREVTSLEVLAGEFFPRDEIAEAD